MNKPTLLISACLLGQPVRYDGQGKALSPDQITQLQQHYRLVSACPECLGGLPTPRPAAEIRNGSGSAVLTGQAMVVTTDNEDVSTAFIEGARHTLHIAQAEHCRIALLKANSPSCGNQTIYSGHFDGQLQAGSGVTATVLQQEGIRVYNETDIARLLQPGNPK